MPHLGHYAVVWQAQRQVGRQEHIVCRIGHCPIHAILCPPCRMCCNAGISGRQGRCCRRGASLHQLRSLCMRQLPALCNTD